MRFIDHRRSTGSVRDRLGPSSPRDVPWASGQSSPRSECSSSSRWFSLFSGAISEVTAPWRIVRGARTAPVSLGDGTRRGHRWQHRRLSHYRDSHCPGDGLLLAMAARRPRQPFIIAAFPARKNVYQKGKEKGGRGEAAARARIDIPVRFQFPKRAKLILMTRIKKKKNSWFLEIRISTLNCVFWKLSQFTSSTVTRTFLEDGSSWLRFFRTKSCSFEKSTPWHAIEIDNSDSNPS